MDIEHIDTVPPRADGWLLHDYLRGCWPYLNTHCWQQLLADRSLEIDDVPLKILGQSNPRLASGQTLHYQLRGYQEDAVDCNWQLLWQGEDIFAVHKPASLPVSRTTRNFYNTLIRLIRREGEWPDAHLLHRLDLDTAGIILLAKNKGAAQYWQPKIHSLLHRKVYRAIVCGVPSWRKKEFECELATRADSPIRCQMHVCDDGEKGKVSRSKFTCLASSSEVGSSYSLIECEIYTGRKHQIRAQLAHLGHPLVGDKIYAHGGSYFLKRLNDSVTAEDERQLQTSHHLLFAQSVALNLLGEDQGVGDISRLPSATVVNTHYPAAWRDFCDRVKLEY